MHLSEAQTRQDLIDSQLAKAGWSTISRSLIEEFYIKSGFETREDRAQYSSKGEFADYVLLDKTNKPLAIVEAKKTSRDALAGKRQASDYADLIKQKFGFDPFIFLTNGNEIQFWDRVNYPPRTISGFYTRDDLERLLHQRKFAQPPADIDINADIADRDYQNEAIRRVTEGIQQAKRSFLLVMATGTGKTRTTIALVDVLLRAKRAQRILFLADRRELVRQAMSEFKTRLSNESLARIENSQTSGARIQFATYPSMMQVYERLSVGYYDLIVADESHRSIYQRYKAIFDHFDAIRLGLTATPTDYIDHNTFELFDCQDGIPSYHYGYGQAVADGGTIFLDEIGDMPLTMQVKLLRVMQEKELLRVGGVEAIPIDVRFIAATHRDLKEDVEKGYFRQDLFYRINVITIRLPPLVEREGDVPLLAYHFLGQSIQAKKKNIQEIDRDALALLSQYGWPGNIRELENVIESAVTLGKGSKLVVEDLPDYLRDLTIETFRRPDSDFPTLEEYEKRYIEWVLEKNEGNKTKAARVLGIDRVSLWRKIKRYNL